MTNEQFIAWLEGYVKGVRQCSMPGAGLLFPIEHKLGELKNQLPYLDPGLPIADSKASDTHYLQQQAGKFPWTPFVRDLP